MLPLTTTSRRSGEKRTAPVLYLRDGDRLVVIGSNAGHKRPPAWSLNLVANPDAEVEIGRERRRIRARVAEGEERARLWRQMNEEHYEGFDDYDRRTSRQIRLFVLEPRQAGRGRAAGRSAVGARRCAGLTGAVLFAGRLTNPPSADA